MRRPLALAFALLIAVPARAEEPEAPEEPGPLTPERRDRILERNLDQALGQLDPEDDSDAIASLVFGGLAGGGAVWVASETGTPRATWAVILGMISASALTDGVFAFAVPDPTGDCLDFHQALPSDTPEDVSARLATGRACLAEAARRGRTIRYLELARDLGIAGGVLALYFSEPPDQRDTVLAALAGVQAGFSLFNLAPSDAESLLDRHDRLAGRIRWAPATVLDRRGAPAPALALGASF
jgi:hypothetical protein